MTYRALPDGLYISTSPVAGQGVFTSKSLPVGTELGMSHIIIADEIIRTPLGGFINHSDTPNCEKLCPRVEKMYNLTKTHYKSIKKYYVKVIRPIAEGEELFLSYTFYKV
ncbi:MAG: hypothetical protein CMA50_02365 [Euryarchaeota archaeon]|nr:hypothetical protein [Euryarchaeota archaeon]